MDGPLNGIYIPDLQKSVVYTNKDYVLPYVDFGKNYINYIIKVNWLEPYCNMKEINDFVVWARLKVIFADS